MSEPKTFASLSSTLLARKGQARPAMRPQLITTNSTLEDLGWNDMGFEPAPAVEEIPQPDLAAAPTEVEDHPVGRAHSNIAEAFTSMPALSSRMIRKPLPVPAMDDGRATAVRAAPGAKGKAAFTLRLDTDRHLKLRVACAMRHQSAQQLVTEALDQLLAALPDIDVSGWHGTPRSGSRN